jgi:hypothetical protein
LTYAQCVSVVPSKLAARNTSPPDAGCGVPPKICTLTPDDRVSTAWKFPAEETSSRCAV